MTTHSQADAWFGEEDEAAFQMLVRWCAAAGYILQAHLCTAKFGPEAEVWQYLHNTDTFLDVCGRRFLKCSAELVCTDPISKVQMGYSCRLAIEAPFSADWLFHGS